MLKKFIGVKGTKLTLYDAKASIRMDHKINIGTGHKARIQFGFGVIRNKSYVGGFGVDRSSKS
jgi:hypothetical protein